MACIGGLHTDIRQYTRAGAHLRHERGRGRRIVRAGWLHERLTLWHALLAAPLRRQARLHACQRDVHYDALAVVALCEAQRGKHRSARICRQAQGHSSLGAESNRMGRAARTCALAAAASAAAGSNALSKSGRASRKSGAGLAAILSCRNETLFCTCSSVRNTVNRNHQLSTG